MLDEDDVGRCLVERAQQACAPARAPGLVDRREVGTHEGAEARILRARRIELQELDARRDPEIAGPRPARGQHDARAMPGEGAAQGGHAPQVAGPQQVLDMGEYARRGRQARGSGARLGRRIRCPPAAGRGIGGVAMEPMGQARGAGRAGEPA